MTDFQHRVHKLSKQMAAPLVKYLVSDFTELVYHERGDLIQVKEFSHSLELLMPLADTELSIVLNFLDNFIIAGIDSAEKLGKQHHCLAQSLKTILDFTHIASKLPVPICENYFETLKTMSLDVYTVGDAENAIPALVDEIVLLQRIFCTE